MRANFMRNGVLSAIAMAAVALGAQLRGGDDGGSGAAPEAKAARSAVEWVVVPESPANLERAKWHVDHSYKIMTREVSIAQYCEFLNSVAKMDLHNLYDKRMRIVRKGFPTKYSYAPKEGYANHPVTFINFPRAARFANWMHNGKPTGKQVKGVTEDGAYDMTGDLKSHSKTAKFWIPTEREWCKAAYYDPKRSETLGKAFYYDFGDKSSYNPDRYPKAEPPPGGAHSANYNEKLKDTTPVGAYASAVSAYGLFDMNGNVFEWTETSRDAASKNIRGGAWNYGGNYILFSTRTGARLREASAGYGFRLAAKVE